MRQSGTNQAYRSLLIEPLVVLLILAPPTGVEDADEEESRYLRRLGSGLWVVSFAGECLADEELVQPVWGAPQDVGGGSGVRMRVPGWRGESEWKGRRPITRQGPPPHVRPMS
jgi:hypothetical protein